MDKSFSRRIRATVSCVRAFRIHDALLFYQTLGTLNAANSQLQIMFDTAIRTWGEGRCACGVTNARR
jgi:hypothetical protein